jgi:hypothetical protein
MLHQQDRTYNKLGGHKAQGYGVAEPAAPSSKAICAARHYIFTCWEA